MAEEKVQVSDIASYNALGTVSERHLPRGPLRSMVPPIGPKDAPMYSRCAPGNESQGVPL